MRERHSGAGAKAHLGALLAGLLCGVLLGVLVLYVNPLTAARGASPDGFDWVWRHEVPADDLLLLTHGGAVPLSPTPAGVDELWEETIDAAALTVAVLEGEDGMHAAIASRITVPSERTELVRRGVILNDYWLMTVPGGGSLFVVADSNVWPVVKDSLLNVSLLGRAWPGPRSYDTTDGPGLGGTALALGATGRFSGQEGSAAERVQLDRFSRARGVEHAVAEMRLRLLPAEGAAAAP